MSKRKQVSLIMLCWALYLTSYVAKYSYASNINPIMSFYSVSKSEAGFISTLFFFSYGAGQIINGLLCKFYNKKYVIAGAMIISGIINGIIFFQPSFFYIKILWLINGIAQSILWSSLMLILSENLDDELINKAVFAMSTTVPIGTCIAYGGSALFLHFDTLFYKYSFLLGAIMAILIGVIWLLLYSLLTKKNDFSTDIKTEKCGKEIKQEKKSLGFTCMMFFISLCVFAVIVNFVKDGLNTWFPTIIKETFNFDDSLSVLLTFVLPVFGVFGSTLALTVNKKIKDFIILTGVFFFAISLIIFIVLILFSLKSSSVWVCVAILACFGVISCVMYGQNNVITSIAPFSFRKKMNSGMVSGLLNGFCYLGSTLATYLLGLIADNSNWNNVFILLLILSLIPVCYSVIYGVVKLTKNKKV